MTALLCMFGIPAVVVLFAFLCGWAQGDFLASVDRNPKDEDAQQASSQRDESATEGDAQ